MPYAEIEYDLRFSNVDLHSFPFETITMVRGAVTGEDRRHLLPPDHPLYPGNSGVLEMEAGGVSPDLFMPLLGRIPDDDEGEIENFPFDPIPLAGMPLTWNIITEWGNSGEMIGQEWNNSYWWGPLTEINHAYSYWVRPKMENGQIYGGYDDLVHVKIGGELVAGDYQSQRHIGNNYVGYPYPHTFQLTSGILNPSASVTAVLGAGESAVDIGNHRDGTEFDEFTPPVNWGWDPDTGEPLEEFFSGSLATTGGGGNRDEYWIGSLSHFRPGNGYICHMWADGDCPGDEEGDVNCQYTINVFNLIEMSEDMNQQHILGAGHIVELGVHNSVLLQGQNTIGGSIFLHSEGKNSFNTKYYVNRNSNVKGEMFFGHTITPDASYHQFVDSFNGTSSLQRADSATASLDYASGSTIGTDITGKAMIGFFYRSGSMTGSAGTGSDVCVGASIWSTHHAYKLSDSVTDLRNSSSNAVEYVNSSSFMITCPSFYKNEYMSSSFLYPTASTELKLKVYDPQRFGVFPAKIYNGSTNQPIIISGSVDEVHQYYSSSLGDGWHYIKTDF